MSGAGKSTLVRCLNFLEKPSKGTVFIDNQDLSSLSQKRALQGQAVHRDDLSAVQSPHAAKCAEECMLSLEIAGVKKKEAEARAYELLELVVCPISQGLSVTAFRWTKAACCHCRALANNPKVILCDERPAPDPATTKGLTLLKDINKRLGITIVIITHEMSVVEEICKG